MDESDTEVPNNTSGNIPVRLTRRQAIGRFLATAGLAATGGGAMKILYEGATKIPPDEKRETGIQATAQAVERKTVQQLESEGMPRMALESSFSLVVWHEDVGGQGGSANLFRHTDPDGHQYLVAITAGHCLKHPDNLSISSVTINRKSPLVTDDVSFPINKDEFGSVAYYDPSKDDGIDIGLMVFPVSPDFQTHFNINSLPSIEDIYWGELPEEGKAYGVNFPSLTSFEPTVIEGASFVAITGNQWTLDGALIAPGSSGGGVFLVLDDGTTQYVGPAVSEPTDRRLYEKPERINDIYVCPLANFGREDFGIILNEAIQDLET